SVEPGAPTSGIVGRRLAALDAEIDRLARLRESLARRASGDD
ncbi:MerR family transcriptional regulator, partial [Actinacidiphila oryziradicis]